MQNAAILLLITWACFPAAAITLPAAADTSDMPQDFSQTGLFDAGQDGYHTFRIPALVVAKNGDVLAFAEARKASEKDTGDIDLVVRRSSDGGEMWSDLEMVGDLGDHTYGNPTPIVAEDGTIHLLTTSNDGHDNKTAIRNGTGHDIRRVHYQRSTDHGRTWTEPREITNDVTPDGADWRWYATGPGHGIQLTRGEHAGRLIAGCDHSDHDRPAADNMEATNTAHVIYSDDGGDSWRVGGTVHTQDPAFRPWESTAVELTDGRVYLNMRNQARAAMLRVEAFSDDGGASFGQPALAEELLDPHSTSRGVQASVLRYAARDAGDDEDRLLFSHPDSRTARERMTVRSSFDEARSWNRGRVIHEGPAGYSDLARLPDATIGVLYENGDSAPEGSGDYRQRITFARFTIDWLDAGSDSHGGKHIPAVPQ